jgi:hypothetical protein
MRLRTAKRLHDAKSACQELVVFCDGKTEDEFLGDRRLNLVVYKLIEIAGGVLRQVETAEPGRNEIALCIVLLFESRAIPTDAEGSSPSHRQRVRPHRVASHDAPILTPDRARHDPGPFLFPAIRALHCPQPKNEKMRTDDLPEVSSGPKPMVRRSIRTQRTCLGDQSALFRATAAGFDLTCLD